MCRNTTLRIDHGDLPHFTIRDTRRTPLGTFVSLYEVDCGDRYYHRLETQDLSAEGIARGTTQLQGRPRAHQESEELYESGLSYRRYSAEWESAPPEVSGGGQDWRLDRGVIQSVTSTQLTLKEADGRVQQIPLSSTTKVIGLGGHRVPLVVLVPRWHVLVTWPATASSLGPRASCCARCVPKATRRRSSPEPVPCSLPAKPRPA